MVTDTTALAKAIRATRDAVASMETAMNYRTAGRAADATVALLAALSGVPERLAALEQFEVDALAFRALVLPQNERLWAVERAAREIPITRYLSNPHEITWRLDAVEAALAALDGAGEGVGGG